MKKRTLLLSLFFGFLVQSHAQGLYTATKGKVSFYSHTVLEDIEAYTNILFSGFNTQTNKVVVEMRMASFNFKKNLMRKHFNENYIESDKFPYAKFTGSIPDSVKFDKDGIYETFATGVFEVHGVAMNRGIPLQIVKKGNKISVTSKFIVRLEDHGIKIPSIVAQNIAEEVEVTFITDLNAR